MTNTANTIAARLMRLAAAGRRARLTMTAAMILTDASATDIRAAVAADSGLAMTGRAHIGLRS